MGGGACLVLGSRSSPLASLGLPLGPPWVWGREGPTEVVGQDAVLEELDAGRVALEADSVEGLCGGEP